jgi:hypothetical protein
MVAVMTYSSFEPCGRAKPGVSGDLAPARTYGQEDVSGLGGYAECVTARASGLVAMPEDASAAELASPMPNSAPWDIAPSDATSGLYAPVTPYSRQARSWNRDATTSGALIFRFNALRTCRMELHQTEAELAVQL